MERTTYNDRPIYQAGTKPSEPGVEYYVRTNTGALKAMRTERSKTKPDTIISRFALVAKPPKEPKEPKVRSEIISGPHKATARPEFTVRVRRIHGTRKGQPHSYLKHEVYREHRETVGKWVPISVTHYKELMGQA